MPLVQINCSKPWYPPEDPNGVWDSMTKASIWLRRQLTIAVSAAVNHVDQLRHIPPIERKDVFVNFGLIHPCAENASEMQIFIKVGSGELGSSPQAQAVRRAVIRDQVEADLHDGMRRCEGMGFEWPVFDIEVELADLSGFTVTPEGTISNRWGDPRV